MEQIPEQNVYNQSHQEQIVAGETTQNTCENPAVQEQVIVQEIPQTPQVQIVERIQEQIVELIDVLAPARTYAGSSQQLPSIIKAVTTGVNLDMTGLVKPLFSITGVKVSAPQAVGSFSPLEEFDAPVYNQIHQELIVAGETTQNTFENRAVQEQVIVQEIPQTPQVQIVERIQEQIVELIDVRAPARNYAAPSQQLPSIIKAVTTGVNLDMTGLVKPLFSITGVEVSAPQAVGSFSPLEEFDAPVYNQIHQELIVAGETTQNTFENRAVQEQVIVQEIPQTPQVQIVERIQEQIVELIDVLAPARTYAAPSQQLPSIIKAVTTGVNLDMTSLVKPLFSITGVEVSAPQAVGSFSPLEEFDAPVYNQIHQELIVAGETTQNTFENRAVQEQVIVQEIPQTPQVQNVERIQEQIVELIDVLAPARTYTGSSQQLPSIIKAVTTGVNLDMTGLVKPLFSITGVEVSAPQAVGSFSPLEEFDAPVYNQIHQELIVAGETTQNTFENRAVQEQVIVQEIPQTPQVQIVERIQEQIVELIDVLAPARTYAGSSQQLPSIIKAVTTGVNLDMTGLVKPLFSITGVEVSAPQAVGSFSPLEEFDAPVYNQIHQELIVAGETTQKPSCARIGDRSENSSDSTGPDCGADTGRNC